MFVASITKESINEGLDFACHLSTDAILDKGNSSPDKALELLQTILVSDKVDSFSDGLI
jgi:hypothetical protein